jgi:putative transferase (TIGR04331 family)
MILIPVSLEKKILSKKDTILLGQWCNNKYTNGIPQENILPYHWDDGKKRERDYKYINSLYEILLPEYAQALNSYHNSSYSLMFWRIVCGVWLKSFITVAFDRWSMAKLAIESHNIEEVVIHKSDENLLTPKNMSDYTNSCLNSDEWNSYIFYKIFKEFSNVKINEFQIYSSKKNTTKKSNNIKSWAFYIKKKASFILGKTLGLFSKKNEIIFVDSYLPIFEQWKLETKLKQFPSLFKFDDNLLSTSLNKDREELTISYHPKNDFEFFLFSLVSCQIPVSYLEDFHLIKSNFSKFPIYSSVKVVFSANAHLHNDQFNIWSAHAKENGAKLILGQHGGGTRSLKNDQNLDHEYEICDYYIAWGKGGSFNKKDVVLPVNKFSQHVPIKLNKNGLLHVLDTNSRYIMNLYSSGVTSSFSHYLNSQKALSTLIHSKSAKKYKLRPNKNSINTGRTIDFGFAGKNMFDKEKHFIDSIKNNRLIIITVNQTTLLQSLVMNIPTVGFWDMKTTVLKENSLNDYQKLYDVGILYDSPEGVAKHINEQWENIEKWWNSPKLQIARKEFCDEYIYTTTNANRIKEWSRFFNQFT